LRTNFFDKVPGLTLMSLTPESNGTVVRLEILPGEPRQ
jgi:hypothetical protein